MKIIRFEHEGKENYGYLKEDLVTFVIGDIFSTPTETEKTIPLAEVNVLPPVTPSKIVALDLTTSSMSKRSTLRSLRNH